MITAFNMIIQKLKSYGFKKNRFVKLNELVFFFDENKTQTTNSKRERLTLHKTEMELIGNTDRD